MRFLFTLLSESKSWTIMEFGQEEICLRHAASCFGSSDSHASNSISWCWTDSGWWHDMNFVASLVFSTSILTTDFIKTLPCKGCSPGWIYQLGVWNFFLTVVILSLTWIVDAGLNSEQSALVDFLVLMKGERFVGFGASTFSFYLAEIRNLDGMPRERSVLVNASAIGTDELFARGAFLDWKEFGQLSSAFLLRQKLSFNFAYVHLSRKWKVAKACFWHLFDIKSWRMAVAWMLLLFWHWRYIILESSTMEHFLVSLLKTACDENILV